VHPQWLYQLIKLAQLAAKLRTSKTDENKTKNLKVSAMLFFFVFVFTSVT